MALIGKVHPDCVNVANPYHECTENCLRKIAEGKGRKNKKKTGYCLIHYLILTFSFCLPPPTFFFFPLLLNPYLKLITRLPHVLI